MTAKGAISGFIVASKAQSFAEAAVIVQKTTEKRVPTDVLAQLQNLDRCLRSLSSTGRPSAPEADVGARAVPTASGAARAVEDQPQGEDGMEKESVGQYIKGVDQTPMLQTDAVGSPRGEATGNAGLPSKDHKKRKEFEGSDGEGKKSKKEKKESKEKKEKKAKKEKN